MPLVRILLMFSLSVLQSLAYEETVQIKQGTLRGRLLYTPEETPFRAFQGIPFAEPPLGNLRFQAPVPKEPWEGVLNATQDANVCYAIDSDSPEEDEDCLYLNVFTPVLDNNNQTRLPVLFWIYGGGFSHGTSLYSNFGPDFLIETDIIIVTTNYRLGPFGYLSTADVLIPGNAGLKDQAAAIKFVFDNIEAFGGDPSKITIAGQSAGAASVGYQLLNKNNEGFFRGAILESGSPLSIWSYLDSAKAQEYAFDLAKLIDEQVDLKKNSSLLLEFLQNVDAKLIDEASTRSAMRPLPVIEIDNDGAFLTQRQYQLLQEGDFIRVPIIIGTNSEEEIHQAADLVKLNKTLANYEEHPQKFLPSDFIIKENISDSLVANAIKDLYLKDVPEDEKMGHIIRFLSHSTFTTPMIKHAELVANYTVVYFYVFSYDGVMGNVNVTIKGADGVDHAEDPKYLFMKNDSSYSNVNLSKFPQKDQITHFRMIDLWSNFVKYLNPTPVRTDLLQNVTWPQYLVGYCHYLDIGEDLQVFSKPKSPYYEKWVQFYEQWAEQPFTTF